MDRLYPNSGGRGVQDGAEVDPTPIRWGDPAWDSITGPALERLQADLEPTARGGAVFARVVGAWKDGVALGSNMDLADELGWKVGAVAEGFRMVRERLAAWQDPVLDIRVGRYSRELVITPRGGVRQRGDLLLSVGGGRPEIAGLALAGAAPVAKNRGMRVICEQPVDGEEQARVLDGGAYEGILILPVDETDDFGALARLAPLAGRVALLDVAARHGGLPCVSFDYAGAGLYCTQALLEMGCGEVLVLTREHDSRAFAIGEGYRRAMRGADGTAARRFVTVDGDAVDTLSTLQAEGLLARGARKLGILCADGELGEAVLRYLDGVPAGRWDVAVAVVGGQRWAARHWAELIWVGLDYTALAAAGARYVTGATGTAVPQVRPRYECWEPRKPVGTAGEYAQGGWRAVAAG